MYWKLSSLVVILFCTTVCSVSLHAQPRYSVVISEIMADPTPQIGLPNAEWLELRNTSNVSINLQGYRLQKFGGTPSGPMPLFNLQPDSSVIVCTGSQVAALSAYGTTISVTSFPSLSNDADAIALNTPAGVMMHAVAYSNTWYKNAVKADGGWTLEMMDTKNPCTGIDNWTASTDAKGGTPGKKNSVDRVNADNNAPRLMHAFATNPQLIQLVFNEPLDSIKASGVLAYIFSDGISISSATPVGVQFDKVNLFISTPLAPGKLYTVGVSGITDCNGKTIDNNFSSAKVGLFSLADSNDVVVNEILFNPNPQGVDYVELYNRSNKIINLQQLMLANRSSVGQLGTFTPITSENFPFFPKDFLVLSSNPAMVAQQFTVLKPGSMLPLSSMPSYPDDKGWAVVLNNAGTIIDELTYDEKWHFALLDNKEGIALERIDYHAATNSKDNWTSAANTAGYGTPTSVNSQYKTAGQPKGEITVTPKMFSPDNDGFEDYVLIEFRFPAAGYVANVTIMDAAGRPIRVLQRNTTCAATGSFKWDGLNDKQQKVALGPYIIFTEIFNLTGSKQVFKNTVSVARKF
jgi:hypothetical protein